MRYWSDYLRLSKIVINLCGFDITYTQCLCVHQIPDIKTGSDRIDAVVVDEESVGSLTAPGCGGKILRGDGALEQYLAKIKDSEVQSFIKANWLVFSFENICYKRPILIEGWQKGSRIRRFTLTFHTSIHDIHARVSHDKLSCYMDTRVRYIDPCSNTRIPRQSKERTIIE